MAALSGLAPRSPPAAGAAALLRLQRGLTGERALAGSGYMDDPDSLAAYFSYYWPVSYLQVSMALMEIRARDHLFRPFRVLDLGAGPGPATAAVHDFTMPGGASRNRNGGEDFACTLADGSAAALSMAGKAMAVLAPRAVAEFPVCDLRGADSLRGLARRAAPDLVVACHTLNELWKDKADAVGRRAALMAGLWEELSDGAVLLVLEPAALATARPLLALRDALLARLDGAALLAPCTTARACPALAAGPDRSCHSEWPWTPPPAVAGLAAAAGLDRNSVKCAWFALRKSGPAPAASVPGAVASAPGATASVPGARVVSDPMLNKAGRIRYALCSDRGLVTCSAHRDDAEAARAGFFTLARGDRFTPEGFAERGAPGTPGAAGAGNLGFVPGSRIAALARRPACGGAPSDRGAGTPGGRP